MADAAAQQNMSALYFGDACTAPQDMQAMQALLQSEGLALAQSMLAEAQAAQQLLQASSAPQVQAQHFRRPPEPPDWWVGLTCATEWGNHAFATSASSSMSCLLQILHKPHCAVQVQGSCPRWCLVASLAARCREPGARPAQYRKRMHL